MKVDVKESVGRIQGMSRPFKDKEEQNSFMALLSAILAPPPVATGERVAVPSTGEVARTTRTNEEISVEMLLARSVAKEVFPLLEHLPPEELQQLAEFALSELSFQEGDHELSLSEEADVSVKDVSPGETEDEIDSVEAKPLEQNGANFSFEGQDAVAHEPAAKNVLTTTGDMPPSAPEPMVETLDHQFHMANKDPVITADIRRSDASLPEQPLPQVDQAVLQVASESPVTHDTALGENVQPPAGVHSVEHARVETSAYESESFQPNGITDGIEAHLEPGPEVSTVSNYSAGEIEPSTVVATTTHNQASQIVVSTKRDLDSRLTTSAGQTESASLPEVETRTNILDSPPIPRDYPGQEVREEVLSDVTSAPQERHVENLVETDSARVIISPSQVPTVVTSPGYDEPVLETRGDRAEASTPVAQVLSATPLAVQTTPPAAPLPSLSETGAASLRTEIVSFSQNPARPEIVLNLTPPDYGSVIVRAEGDAAGNVRVTLVVESAVVKSALLLQIPTNSVNNTEVVVYTREEYRDLDRRGREESARQGREERRRQEQRERERSRVEFIV